MRRALDHPVAHATYRRQSARGIAEFRAVQSSARGFVHQRVPALPDDAVQVHDGSGTIRSVRVDHPCRDPEVTQI